MEEKIDYNAEPVYYCKHCLSLKIRNVPRLEDSEYCDECGSTNVDTCSIHEWEAMYEKRHGIRFLNN